MEGLKDVSEAVKAIAGASRPVELKFRRGADEFADPSGGGGGSKENGGTAGSGPPLKDDPTYQKYFKMLKVGLPIGAVKNALVRDGLSPDVMDLDPDKSLAIQQKKKDEDATKEDEDTGPPLKDDPTYQKYFKMRKVGLPVGAVKNALVRDGTSRYIPIKQDENLRICLERIIPYRISCAACIKISLNNIYVSPLSMPHTSRSLTDSICLLPPSKHHFVVRAQRSRSVCNGLKSREESRQSDEKGWCRRER